MFEQFVAHSKENGIDLPINGMTHAFKDGDTERRFKKFYFESNPQMARACHLGQPNRAI